MVSLRSLSVLAPYALGVHGAAAAGLASTYLPAFSWLNGGASEQTPLGNHGVSREYASFEAVPANLSSVLAASVWAQPPQCVTHPALDEPVCVFSLHSFANGRGIALVTSPSNATAFLGTPAASQLADVAPDVNVQKSAIMEEREIPGAGRGMVATKSLYAGDNIFTYTPILLITDDVTKLEQRQRLALYRQAVQSLPAKTRKLFWELAPQETPDKADPVEDRIDTNSFAYPDFGVDHAIINPEIARLNHDCRPNAVYHFDHETYTQYIHTVRTVLPGEQLTISYLDGSLPRAKRQRRLRRNWGFSCSCSLCTQHAHLTRESDARLVETHQLDRFLRRELKKRNRSASNHTADQVVQAAELQVALYELERYDAFMAEPLRYAAMAHSAAGNYDAAKRYGRRALMAAMLEDGFSSRTVASARNLATDPTKHWSWEIKVEDDEEGSDAVAATDQ